MTWAPSVQRYTVPHTVLTELRRRVTVATTAAESATEIAMDSGRAADDAHAERLFVEAARLRRMLVAAERAS